MKTLITFVYCERNNKVVDENLEFFLKHGILKNDEFHYNFIINGHTCSMEIPESENISVIKRDNLGYDFGAYTASLESVNINEYDYFIFMNDTVRGPFLPNYIPSRITWVEMFVDKLTEGCIMSGPTVNWGKWGHIQSMCFGLSRKGVQKCIEEKIFFGEYRTSGRRCKQDYVRDYEVRMSRVLVGNQSHPPIFLFQLSGWEKQKGTYFSDGYFGDTYNPLEIMFIKTTRINNQTVKNYTYWRNTKDTR